MITHGLSMIEREYDGEDYDLRETYYDTIDQYTLRNGGYARIEWKFEGPDHFQGEGTNTWSIEPNEVKWEKTFGTDLELIERKSGNAGYENFRNEYGQIIRTVYYNDQWQPTRFEEGQFAWIDYGYEGTDPREPAIYEGYFYENGNPTENISGAYARSMVYGGPKKNLLLEEAFWNADGTPDTSVTTGAHRAVYTYDSNLLQTSVRYYDQDGNPFETHTGEAAILREYNHNGNLLWEATFDTEGNPVVVNGTDAVHGGKVL